MEAYEEKDYPIFDLFRNRWALVTAGTMEHYNTCTIGWGTFGTIWSRSVAAVYVHPARYTWDFLKDQDYFTISFFPKECRPALSYLGSHSGRDGDKVAAAGLTPVPMGPGVTFREAQQTFLCRKLSAQLLDKDGLAPDIQHIYSSRPGAFPPDEAGQWQPHWQFIGQIEEVRG